MLYPPFAVKVYAGKDGKSFHIFWHPSPSSGVIGYNVYRTTAPNGVIIRLNNTLVTDLYYTDTLTQLVKKMEVYWYAVTAVSNVEESKITDLETFNIHEESNWIDIMLAEMLRRNYWMLNEDGEWVDLWRRKVSGERCPVCYDSIRGQASSSNCTFCYGTSFKGGYEKPQRIKIRRRSAARALMFEETGVRIEDKPAAWTLPGVMIKNKDVIVLDNNFRFFVTGITDSITRGIALHTDFNMQEIDQTLVEYKLGNIVAGEETSNLITSDQKSHIIDVPDYDRSRIL